MSAHCSASDSAWQAARLLAAWSDESLLRSRLAGCGLSATAPGTSAVEGERRELLAGIVERLRGGACAAERSLYRRLLVHLSFPAAASLTIQ